MSELTLSRCVRCGLTWVQGSEIVKDRCPACYRQSNIPTEIVVMGRDVKECVVREYGLETGLLNPRVRQGIENLDLGYCEHGWITPLICPDCTKIIMQLR